MEHSVPFRHRSLGGKGNSRSMTDLGCVDEILSKGILYAVHLGTGSEVGGLEIETNLFDFLCSHFAFLPYTDYYTSRK